MRIGPGHTLLVPAKEGATADNLLSVNLPVATPTTRKAPGKSSKKAANKGGKQPAGKKRAPAKTVSKQKSPARN